MLDGDAPSEKKPQKRDKFVLVVLSLILLCILGGGGVLWVLYENVRTELDRINHTQQTQYETHVETKQFLLSTIDWSSRRLKTILFMRDQIVGEWKRIGCEIKLEKAYLIAETNMREAEKYPHIDPMLILAMQWKESSFRDSVVSKAGAVGLNQLMPATARLLAGFFSENYSSRKLRSIRVSTKWAVKYLDVLYAQYPEEEIILAGYNGGPWQAFYYKHAPKKLAAETREYVPQVLQKRETYLEKFMAYKVESEFIKEK